MKLNYLAFVLPAFLIVCMLEYYFSLKKEKKIFRFSETISNFNVGIFERTCDLFSTALFHFYFVWLYEHYAVFHIQTNVITWVVLFLFTDLLWYWYHRMGHRVNILWSGHIVHHQSEDFNFTVSARITVVQALVRTFFWSFIPILGFPPEMITVILLVHGAYPIFTHTQVIGKLGVLEKFLVTPSHHRVHHSSNEKYLDKNFGDVLIIWDKLFGTFAEEDEKEEITYGITEPLNNYSFLWQHFHFLMEIAETFKRAKNWKAKWRAVFGTPEEIDPGIRKELERKWLSQAPKKNLTRQLSSSIIINTILNITFIFFFLLFGYHQTPYQLLAGTLLVFVSVIHTGAMLEQRKWIFHLEFIRLVALSVYISLLVPTLLFVVPAIAVLLALTLFYRTANNYYLLILNIDTSLYHDND